VKIFGIFSDLYKDTLDVPSLHFWMQKLFLKVNGLLVWERVLAVVIVKVFRSLIKYIRKLPARQRLILVKASINKTILPILSINKLELFWRKFTFWNDHGNHRTSQVFF
jgi:hypothetical protein